MLTSTELSSSHESNKSACVEASLVRSINSCSLEVCFCGASCRRSDLLLELPEELPEESFRAGPAFFLGSYHFMTCLQRVRNKVHFELMNI